MAEQRKGETPEPQLRRAKKHGSRLHEIVEILRHRPGLLRALRGEERRALRKKKSRD